MIPFKFVNDSDGSNNATIVVAHGGTSFITGSSPAPGGSRISFFNKVRQTRSNVIAWGPVIAGLSRSVSLGDLRCAGYPGETISQITTRCQAGGSIYTYANLATSETPNIFFWNLGTNDAAASNSSATMIQDLTAHAAAVSALFPNTFHVYETIPHLYSPVAPGIGLSAANANIDAFNTFLLNSVTSTFGPLFSAIDPGSQQTQGLLNIADGTHPTVEGQAITGVLEAQELDRLIPIGGVGSPSPRSFTKRTAQSSFISLTPTTDNVTVTDPEFELTATSFAIAMELRLTNLVNGTNSIAQCTPSGQNYSHGWLIAYDSTTNYLSVYFKSLGALVSAQMPTDALSGRPMYLCVHGDLNALEASIFLAYTPSGSDKITVGRIGQAQGISAWTAGDSAGQLIVGKTPSFSGFTGQIRRIEISSGTQVPNCNQIQSAFEEWIFEGKPISGFSAGLMLNEGTGTTVYTTNNISGTLTGGWASAGSIPWLHEENGGLAILNTDGYEWSFSNDSRIIAVFDATYGTTLVTGKVSAWSSTIGNATATQGAGANRPTYNATGINGFPTIDFDGSATFLSVSGLSAPLGDKLYIAVIYPTAGTFNTGRWLLDIDVGRTIFAVNESSVGNQIAYYGAGWSPSGITATGAAQILAMEFKNGIGTRFFLNGALIATDAVNSVNTAISSVIAIGSNNGGSSSYYSGKLGMLVVASGKIDDALRTKITRKMAAMYGLSIST